MSFPSSQLNQGSPLIGAKALPQSRPTASQIPTSASLLTPVSQAPNSAQQVSSQQPPLSAFPTSLTPGAQPPSQSTALQASHNTDSSISSSQLPSVPPPARPPPASTLSEEIQTSLPLASGTPVSHSNRIDRISACTNATGTRPGSFPNNINPPSSLPDIIMADPESSAQANDENDVIDEPTSNQTALNGLLIGYGGKDVIKDAWENTVVRADEGSQESNMKNARKFFDDFRAEHGLNFTCINEVLTFLESAGISRHQFGRVLMSNLINLMKQRIRNMNQTQLSELLDSSYSYLTVTELAPIAILAMEHLKHVESSILTEIVGNGLHNSPYIDLPLPLKHKIWNQEKFAFKHELEVVLVRVTDLKPPSFVEMEMRPTPDMRKQENMILSDLLTLCYGLDDTLMAVAAEQIYEKACHETSPLRRVALANLFHDFMIMAPNRATSTTLAIMRKFGRILSGLPPSGGTNAPSKPFRPSPSDLQTIFEHVSHADSRAYVSLLLSSSISRDFLADQIILQLFDCRGDVGNGEDEKLLQEAQDHLRSQKLLVFLVHLMLYNIKGMNVVLDRDTVLVEEVEQQFQQFLPLIIGEMYTDVTARADDYSKSLDPPAGAQLAVLATQGRFERRVITSYCLFLFLNQDIPALMRQRLTLNAIVATSDPKEEAREYVIASTLSRKLNEV